MSSYTNIFGGANVDVANPSLNTIALSALTPQVTLAWPIQFQDTKNVTANIIEITADAGGRSIIMPQANQVSVGQALILNNLSGFSVTIYTADGVTVLVTLAPTSVVEIYLVNNTTASIPSPTIIIGTWRAIPWGGGTVSVTSISAAPAAGVTAANLSIAPPTITTTGTFTFTFLGDLLALANFGAGTGMPSRTAANTWALRTITGTANQITVTNGDGVAANPTISLPATITGINNLTVGNINITANTISSTNANGNIILAPNGTGATQATTNLVLQNDSYLQFNEVTNTFSTSFKAGALTSSFTHNWPTVAPTVSQVLGVTALGPPIQLGWTTVTTFGGPSTINAIAKYTSVSGSLGNSGVLINGTNDISGANSLTAQNIQISTFDANSISSVVGNIIFRPNGGSEVQSANNFGILNQKVLKIYGALSTNFIGLQAGTLTGNTTFTLPTADGVLGQSMTTNGAAALTFSDIPGNNRILNGDFKVWQRGAGGTASFAITNTTQYGPDRWQIKVGAATNATFTQQAGAISGDFLCRAQRNNGDVGTAPIIVSSSLWRQMSSGAAQRLVTLSFKARIGANFSGAANQITVSIFSGTGTTDVSNLSTGFTGQNAEINVAQTLTTTLTNYSFTTGVLGASVSQLEVRFTFTPTGAALAADYFDITDVQLELGANQTPFSRLSFTNTYNLCTGYYQKSFSYPTAPASAVGTGTGESLFLAFEAGATAQRGSSIPFSPGLIVVPSGGKFTTFNPAAAGAQVHNETRGGDCTATAVVNLNDKRFNIECTGTGGTVLGDYLAIHWTVDVDVV